MQTTVDRKALFAITVKYDVDGKQGQFRPRLGKHGRFLSAVDLLALALEENLE